jgi:FtsP/CotA-like multicopper oxidase with cupredoxin domain
MCRRHQESRQMTCLRPLKDCSSKQKWQGFFVVLLLLGNGPVAMANTQNFVEAYDRFLGQTPNSSTVQVFELTAKPTELKIGNGKATTVWAYNGQIPGPTLRAKQGQSFKVSFKNELPEPTTIHWHGVRVPNGMDGVPGVTQKPVAPGETFVYEFQALDSGTYWFHPHVRSHEQVERGLYGVLIVESPEDPVYDREWVWVLDDWLLDDQGAIDDSFSKKDLDTGGRLGSLLTINGKDRPEYSASAGERVRIRIINSSNARNYQLDFKGARAKIFAVDGNLTGQTLVVEDFDIAPGNRIDVDLTIPDDVAGDSTIEVANRFFHREARGGVLEGPQILAGIKISGRVDGKNDFQIPTHGRVPGWDDAHETEVDFTYEFNTEINLGLLWNGGPAAYFVINGKQYGEHEITPLKHRQFYHLRFTNGTGLYHPIHIHGMFFKVLSRNGTKVNEPYFRDTVLLDYDGSIEIGVVPVDEGKWMLHCHLLEHSALGMMTLVEVKK